MHLTLLTSICTACPCKISEWISYIECLSVCHFPCGENLGFLTYQLPLIWFTAFCHPSCLCGLYIVYIYVSSLCKAIQGTYIYMSSTCVGAVSDYGNVSLGSNCTCLWPCGFICSPTVITLKLFCLSRVTGHAVGLDVSGAKTPLKILVQGVCLCTKL